MIIVENIQDITQSSIIVKAKGCYCVSKFIFRLILKQKIGVDSFMTQLQQQYQKLTKINKLTQYEIIPINIEFIDREIHNKIALGGTFDYMHAGHIMLLTYAAIFAYPQGQVIVGITGISLLKNKKNKQIIQPLATRIRNVQQLLERLNIKNQRLFELTQPYGPTIHEQDITSMVFSQQTAGAESKINQIRQQNKLPPLKGYVMRLFETQGDKDKVSSTYIREHLLQKNNIKINEFIEYKKYWDDLYSRYLRSHKLEEQQRTMEYRDTWFNRIFVRYSEEWRYYHTNYHILTLLNNKTSLENQLEDILLEFAIWFHDLIYEPNRNDNQERSSIEFQDFAKGLETLTKLEIQDETNIICNLILSTKSHKASTTLQRKLSDLDMGILNSDLQTYKLYAKQIQQQYQPLFKTSSEFKVKRRQFLASLDPSTVFYEIENRSGENIKWEIQELSQQ